MLASCVLVMSIPTLGSPLVREMPSVGVSLCATVATSASRIWPGCAPGAEQSVVALEDVAPLAAPALPHRAWQRADDQCADVLHRLELVRCHHGNREALLVHRAAGDGQAVGLQRADDLRHRNFVRRQFRGIKCDDELPRVAAAESTLKTPLILLSSGTIWSRASCASCAGVSLLEVRLSWTMGCEGILKVCTCGVVAPCGSASAWRLL